jgi:hypothetical protein
MRLCRCRGGNNVLALGVTGVVLALLAVSCATTPTPYGPVPPAVTSTMLQQTVERGAVDLYLSGIQAQETLQAVHAMETATAVAGRATATAQAQAIAATRAAWEAEATRTAWVATATAASHQATATSQAQAAAATATATAWAATATADAVAWSQAATATRSAWEVDATTTAVYAAAVATAQAAQAEQARLEAERARLTYPVRAYGPWVLLLTAFALLLWAGYRMTKAAEARVRAVPRDARGDAPILVLPLQGGGETVIDPDRSFGPALEVRGEVSQPQLAPPEYQAGVVARDQAVDLVSRGLPGSGASHPRRRLPPGFGGGLRRVLVLRRLDQAAASGVLPPPMVQALEADWRKVQEGEVEE